MKTEQNWDQLNSPELPYEQVKDFHSQKAPSIVSLAESAYNYWNNACLERVAPFKGFRTKVFTCYYDNVF